MEQKTESRLMDIPLESIDISENNVRVKQADENLEELENSMRNFGLLQPVVVWEKNGKYELIIGQRRYLAAIRLNWATIRAWIREPMTAIDAKVVSLSENIQRRRINADDMSDACYELVQKLGSVAAVAQALGISAPTVSKYFGFKTLPDWLKDLVRERQLTLQRAVKLWDFVGGDETRAKLYAEKMIPMTRNEADSLLETLRDADPDESPDQVAERAKTRQLMEIVIHLPEKDAEGLGRAAKHMDREPEDIARVAIRDWLHDNGFV